jgi:hypothetical protein
MVAIKTRSDHGYAPAAGPTTSKMLMSPVQLKLGGKGAAIDPRKRNTPFNESERRCATLAPTRRWRLRRRGGRQHLEKQNDSLQAG